jgi:iron complex outermembrane receptor protein
VLNGVWGFEGQYDFVSARFTDGSYVPKIPPHRVGGGLYYRDPNWMARINLLHAFAQTRLAAFETPTGDYNLLNAELSYTRKFAPASLVPEMTIGIKGENLLNDRIRLHQSYKKDEVLQAGLNVRLFASMKLN